MKIKKSRDLESTEMDQSVTQLHTLVSLYQEEITKEVSRVLASGYSGIEKERAPRNWGTGEIKWRPMFIKYSGENVALSERMPKLREIVSAFPEVPTFYVSVFRPGMVITEEKEQGKKYYYALDCPKGESFTVQSSETVFRCKKGDGLVLSDSKFHSAWNHGRSTHLILVAHIPRDSYPSIPPGIKTFLDGEGINL